MFCLDDWLRGGSFHIFYISLGQCFCNFFVLFLKTQVLFHFILFHFTFLRLMWTFFSFAAFQDVNQNLVVVSNNTANNCCWISPFKTNWFSFQLDFVFTQAVRNCLSKCDPQLPALKQNERKQNSEIRWRKKTKKKMGETKEKNHTLYILYLVEEDIVKISSVARIFTWFDDINVVHGFCVCVGMYSDTFHYMKSYIFINKMYCNFLCYDISVKMKKKRLGVFFSLGKSPRKWSKHAMNMLMLSTCRLMAICRKMFAWELAVRTQHKKKCLSPSA